MMILNPQGISFLLFDSGLELFTKSILKEIMKQNLRVSQNQKKLDVLLENPIHGNLLKSIPEGSSKRGRPDIIHTSLLFALNSPIFLENSASISVHTRNNEIFWARNDWKIPPSYVRFRGIMEELLKYGRVPKTGEQILSLEKDISVEDWVVKQKPSAVLLMDEDGVNISLKKLGTILSTEHHPIILIGGYQRGKIQPQYRKLAQNVYSIYSRSLPTWSILSRCCIATELGLGIPCMK